jgi:hypothetical protein
MPAPSPQAQPAATAPAASSTQPPQTPTPPTAKAAPAKAAAAKPNKEALVQKFGVVLRNAFNTQDENLARQFLKAVSGTDKITDFTEEDLNKYGRVLQGVVKGVNKISDDKTQIIEIATGKAVWGPAPAPSPEKPAGQPDGDLF